MAAKSSPSRQPDILSHPTPFPDSPKPPESATPDEPDYLGHRQRLRDRFLAGGGEALSDHEILELILMAALPRRDTKSLAKRLIGRMGGLGGVFAAAPETLIAESGLGLVAATYLKAVEAAAIRMARLAVLDRPVLSSWEKVIDYCRTRLAHQGTERFHLLFLDVKNVLIADEEQAQGTVNHTPVYPRNVAARALALNASAVVMVHNHPSGDPTPSRADIDMTAQVKDALRAVGVTLHDHLVIGRGGQTSFRTMGLL